MTSYITQTIARQQVAELIAQAEGRRVRRELRRARRAERVARREEDRHRHGPSNSTLTAPQRIRLIGAQ